METALQTETPACIYTNAIVILFVLVGLYLTTFVSYLLFHSLPELFSIGVAFALFIIAWNSRRYIDNPYILFIGIAYLFIAFLDLLHTLSYKGMPIFTDYDFYASRLWIAARFMESLSLGAGFLFIQHRMKLNPAAVTILFTVVSGLLIASIFYWKVFPVCFVEGQGLTAFKKISGYMICSILVMDILLLRKYRDQFDGYVYRLLIISLVLAIASELAFTFYISNYGFSNLVGHYFKLFSFYYIYRSIVKTGIEYPYRLIFHEMTQANARLTDEIAIRKETEKKKEGLILRLTQALDQIKTLEGIIPICMHCKQIRDDKGYWNRIEKYIQDHSDAEFSHSICPDCMQKYYPELAEKLSTPNEGKKRWIKRKPKDPTT